MATEIPVEVYDAACAAAFPALPHMPLEEAERRAKKAAEAVWPLAVAEGRARAAADIRAAIIAGAKVPPWALRNGMPIASQLAEWAARIAEGNHR